MNLPRSHFKRGVSLEFSAVRSRVRRVDTPRSHARSGVSCGVGLWLLLGSLVALTLMPPPSASSQTPAKRVLVITSYDLNRPAIATFIQALRSTLRDGSQARVEFFHEYQEHARISSGKYEAEMVGYLRRKYDGEKFDLVIAAGSAALKLLLRHESELFAGAPKIFYFHDESEETARELWPHVTGVWAKHDFSRTLDVALALQPETQRVAVVSGNSRQDRFLREQAQKDLRGYEDRVEITYLSDLTMEELKRRLAALPEKSIVLYLSFFLDSAGNGYLGPEALSMFAPASGAPVYGISETYMGVGVVGGSLIDFEALGRRTGEVGLRVLSGGRPQDIHPETVPNITVFDWRQLRRWGLDGQELPPGSVVRFKQQTFWEYYKWFIVGVIMACVAEALLIARLLVMQRRRKRAERERERLAGQVEADNRRLHETVSNVPGIVWETLVDPHTDALRTIFISDYVEKMLGYTSTEWLSAPRGLGLRLMPKEDREMAARTSEEVLKTGKNAVIHYRWRTRDGRTLWVESHLNPIVDGVGKVVGLRGVSIDITDKKLAEDARRQSEERNRAILRAIPDLMFLLTRDGVFLDYHARDTKELYASPEEFTGKNVRDVLPPGLAEMVLERFRLVDESGDPQVVEYELRVEGDERWFDARIVGCGENILTVVRDITERKRSETALHDAVAVSERNRAQLESVFQTVSDGVLVSDMAGNVLFINGAMARIHGYESADEMKVNLIEFAPLYEIFYPDGRPIPYEEWPLSRVLRGESVTDWQLRVRRKDTGREWFFSYSGEPVRDEGGAPVLALLVTHDITERKAAEEALRESEARFRNMADTAPVIIWMSGTDRLFTYFNRQCLDLTGRGMDELLGNGWAELVHPDDFGGGFDAYARAFDAREPFTTEYRVRRADGTFRWLLDRGTPRFSAAGEFLGYIGSCIDITDRKESEAALQTLLEEVSRLKNQLQEENIYLKEEIKLEQNFSEIVGRSDAVRYVLHKIEQVAPTDSTVLITGETGTGKELVARAIHGGSLRRDRPLLKVNCAALSPGLIESELFGHEKGAFTGAAGRKIGRFELADGATIFLDEIGELPTELQVKLLRVLQEGEFERLGGNRTLRVDVRIVAATNRNLWKEVQAGTFREDLWYRLNVFPITMPPLRQRAEDIPLLVRHFVKRFSKKMGKRITSVTPATLNALCNYLWPGNVRELANVIERAVINNSGPVLQITNFTEAFRAEAPSTPKKTLEELEREYILTVLDSTGWRVEGQSGAAGILGLHPSTLRTRMAKLKIQKPPADSAPAAHAPTPD